MKYVPPYGTTDPNAHYINGDPSIGQKGSIPPAAVFEEGQRELVNLLKYSWVTPDDNDLTQVTESIRSQRVNFAQDTGSVNYLSVAYDPPLAAYTPGLLLRVRVANTNDGPVTIDAGCGRVNVLRNSGAALAASDLRVNALVDMAYDGTNFQLVNFLGTGAVGDIHNYYINIPYAVDVSPTANIIQANFSPALTVLAAGQPILVKVAHNNSAATIINCNSLSAVTLKAQSGGDLLPEDVVAGGVMLMVYDGTNFIITPNLVIHNNYTINVPTTQFNPPESAIDALQRKMIVPGALITIKLGIGIFAPFKFHHPSANSVKIQGTMRGANPTIGMMARNGSSAATRNADAHYNLAQLRACYGTEIQVPSGGGIGIETLSGPYLYLADLLITDPNASYNNNTQGVGASSVQCNNVACWGLHQGFSAGGIGLVALINCWAIYCYYGFNSYHGGNISGDNSSSGGNQSGVLQCEIAGIYAAAKSYILLYEQYSQYNGVYGFLATDSSTIVGTSLSGTGNGYNDFAAMNMSELRAQGLFGATATPVPNVVGNNNSMIIAT